MTSCQEIDSISCFNNCPKITADITYYQTQATHKDHKGSLMQMHFGVKVFMSIQTLVLLL